MLAGLEPAPATFSLIVLGFMVTVPPLLSMPPPNPPSAPPVTELLLIVQRITVKVPATPLFIPPPAPAPAGRAAIEFPATTQLLMVIVLRLLIPPPPFVAELP